MSGQVAARTQADAAAVSARVRDDHRTLHGLLVILAREAASASARNAGREHVRLALTALRDALLLHLDYEERELVALLRTASAWGPVLVTRVVSEHTAQRASVTALVGDADDGSARNLSDLAEEITWFAKGLERDMEREEVELLAPGALGEEYVASDQEDG